MFTHKKDISRIFESFTDRDYYTVIADFFELSAISIRNAEVYRDTTNASTPDRQTRAVRTKLIRQLIKNPKQ